MKKTHIVLLIVIAILIGFIVSVASDYSRYESFRSLGENSAKEYQVVGFLVKDKDIVYDPQVDANRLEFFMRDNDGEVRRVIFLGSKPQDFERSEQIVLTGKMKDNVFRASSLLMKCPSKYKNNEMEMQEFKAQVKES
jgi:cytochrome c-type biogenesis protein CcmE